MIKVNIHEAKMHLSQYLKKLRPGEAIVLCKRNIPIAEIRLLEQKRSKKRPIGLAKGEFAVPASFMEPLPVEIEDAFSGNKS